ncbi:MAG TPA: sialidase family protein [Acidimicrobiales bacterium]|nr:sialidase family protein [Acidimicrobiales bacterium]
MSSRDVTIARAFAGAGSRRRRVAITAGLLLAASAAFGATALVVSRHPASQLHVSPGGNGTGPGSGSGLSGGVPVPAADLVSDPVFVTSEVGFALATTGQGDLAVERLARSDDGGRTWHVTGSAFPVLGSFSTLQFISAEQGYIFGNAGLLVTADGGKVWSQVQGLNGTLQRAIPLGNNVWATYTSCGSSPPGAAGSCTVGLAISADGGRHWRDTSLPGLKESRDGGDILARWSLDSAYVLSYGVTGGGLAFTPDDGRTWQYLSDPCSAPYAREDLAAPPAPSGSKTALWLICGAITRPGEEGQPKLVYRSFDDAKHWVLVASTGFTPAQASPVGQIPLSGWVSQLATINSTQAWLGLGGVGVVVTLDSGVTWAPAEGFPRTEPDTEVGVTFNNGLLGWAVVFRRGVWRTEDATHWELVDGG